MTQLWLELERISRSGGERFIITLHYKPIIDFRDPIIIFWQVWQQLAKVCIHLNERKENEWYTSSLEDDE